MKERISFMMLMISGWSGKVSLQERESCAANGAGGMNCSGPKLSRSSFVGMGNKAGISSVHAPPISTLEKIRQIGVESEKKVSWGAGCTRI